MFMRFLMALAVATFLASTAVGMDMPDVYKKKCVLCHSIGGEGGKKKDVGGPLDGVGKKRDEAWLRAYILEPKSKMPEAKMPKIKLSTEDLNSVIQYMLSLH